MTAPIRIQLSRARGWRMPPNTVKVDRSTKWGNPFRAGHGNAAECVRLFGWLVERHLLCISIDKQTVDAQRKYLKNDVSELRGKNLACWCRPGAPCHADVLLEVANR